MLEFSGAESASWIRQLEWPQEVVDLLEVWSNGEDFVDDIFNADDTILSEFSLNDGIISKCNTLLVAGLMLATALGIIEQVLQLTSFHIRACR